MRHYCAPSLLVLLLTVNVLPLCHAIQAIPRWEIGFVLIVDERNEVRIFNLDGLPVTWSSELPGRRVTLGNQGELVGTLAHLGSAGGREQRGGRKRAVR